MRRVHSSGSFIRFLLHPVLSELTAGLSLEQVPWGLGPGDPGTLGGGDVAGRGSCYLHNSCRNE